MVIRSFSFLLIAALGAPVSAQQYTLGDLSIERPWSRELPAVAPNGAAYFQVDNGGGKAARIVSARSPIAERAEFHTHETEGGVMKMRHLQSVEVPAQGGVSFEPGGLHVMLVGLKEPLVAGESFPLTLGFQEAGEIEVKVEITAGGMSGHSGHGNLKHGQTQ